jgi:hypothetical protein
MFEKGHLQAKQVESSAESATVFLGHPNVDDEA